MSEALPPIIFQLSVGAIGGFIIGFTIKKLSKLMLFLIGLLVIVLLILGVKGIISINYDALFNGIINMLGWTGTALAWLAHVIALIPFTGSFIIGFILGFKLG